MIQRLEIRNYAIIEHLEIDFSRGMTVITGETGAGKSILLGALGLIMGKRADTKVLYDTSSKCIIEGTFDVAKYRLTDFFEENDIDYYDECNIRREITPSGKSRAFVNDTPVNLKVLQQLTGALVDLHRQFDTLDIHNVSFQLRMLDALAGNRDRLDSYQQGFRKFRADERRLSKLREQSAAAQREMEFLLFQLNELADAELEPDEQTRLEEEQNRLTNAEDIKRNLQAAYQQLVEDEQSVVSQLQTIGNAIEQVSDFDADLSRIGERFNDLIAELEDTAVAFEKIADRTEYDEQRIQEIQERLDVLYRLQNKHHVKSVEELIDIREDLTERTEFYGDISGEIERLEQQIVEQRGKLGKKAATISTARKKVVPSFLKKIHGRLAQLSMPYARLEVSFDELPQLGITGIDDVQYLFAANRGSRLQPIREVASGGELSRLTLVTKSLVASAIPLPTLIFDEIDSGVSGDVSLKMGNILYDLSTEHQVVTITHSPQIAAKANKHYFIYKQNREDRTVTKVRALDHDERVRSIAVMLSQNPPSEPALENARLLLAEAATPA